MLRGGLSEKSSINHSTSMRLPFFLLLLRSLSAYHLAATWSAHYSSTCRPKRFGLWQFWPDGVADLMPLTKEEQGRKWQPSFLLGGPRDGNPTRRKGKITRNQKKRRSIRAGSNGKKKDASVGITCCKRHICMCCPCVSFMKGQNKCPPVNLHVTRNAANVALSASQLEKGSDPTSRWRGQLQSKCVNVKRETLLTGMRDTCSVICHENENDDCRVLPLSQLWQSMKVTLNQCVSQESYATDGRYLAGIALGSLQWRGWHQRHGINNRRKWKWRRNVCRC